MLRVFFGEMPKHLNKVEKLLAECNLFIAIGTSGSVYPAAGFVQIAKENGAKTYLVCTLLFVFGCICIFWIPFIMGSMRDKYFVCAHCSNVLAIKKRL